jgi:hypothetical protein
MVRKIYSRLTHRQRLLLLGAFIALAGIVLASSFQFIQDHRWYWSNAPLVCVVALASVALGGWLMGHSLSLGQVRRLWLAVLGSVLGLGWLGLGALAAILAAIGMYNLPAAEAHIGWNSYVSGYMLRNFDISFLQLAAVTGVLGGFAVGLGLAARRLWPTRALVRISDRS